MAGANTKRSSVERPITTGGVGQVYLLLAIVVVFWGGNFVAAKFAVPHIPPFTISAVRFAITSLCLLLLLRLSRGPRQPVRLSDLPLIFALGATGFTINTGLFYSGMRVATATEGAVIAATNPAITTVLAALILRESFTLNKLGGLILAFVGVVLVATAIEGLSVRPDHLLAVITLLGMATSWAFYSVLGKFALRRFSPLAATTYAATAGTILLVPISLVESGWRPLLVAPADAWLAIGYMVIFSSVISMVVWYRGIARIGASRTAIFNNAVPVAAMLIAAVVLHEAITPGHILGLIFVTAGIFLANRPTPAPSPCLPP
jgi:drug/metabolite transporter (DMT)-like permease